MLLDETWKYAFTKIFPPTESCLWGHHIVTYAFHWNKEMVWLENNELFHVYYLYYSTKESI